MSDDERSGAGSDSVVEMEDVEKNGLVATRAKRSTAGNLYASLRHSLDDDEIMKDLLNDEDETDVGDYEASDREDDDAAMESSSDDEDGGPAKEAEDLDGETALKRAERAEAAKKRKLRDAKFKMLPGRQKKKVKLADEAKAEDGAVEKPKKKKSERANWLPTAADAPTRQSSRSLAQANREVTHANLKKSFERSVKQQKIMANAAEREKPNKREDYTLEKRLKKAAQVAKETKRDFGRWEKEELERQRIRDEMLAAKHRKAIEGPVIRYWSGSGIWNGQKFVEPRVLPEREREEEKDIDDEKTTEQKTRANVDDKTSGSTIAAQDEASSTKAIPTASDNPASILLAPAAVSLAGSAPVATDAAPETYAQTQTQTTQATSWLPGIQDYASLAPASPPQQAIEPSPAPLTNAYGYASTPTASDANAAPSPTPSTMTYQYPSVLPPTYHGWPPGAQQFSAQLSPAPALPPALIIREQAVRACIMLQQFKELELSKKPVKASSTLEPSQTAKVLLPASHPTDFTVDEFRYLTNKHRKSKGDNMPPPPTKPRCVITSWPAKYRDPKTGAAYFDMQMYKALQRILAGGSAWSSLLGAWVGPANGQSIGRPANGVPVGFAGPAAAVKVEGESLES